MTSDEEERVRWAVETCRERGMRRTKALEEVLRCLIGHRGPMKLNDLMESESIKGLCDQATIYRMLIRLEDKGLVRRLGLHDRAAWYVFKYPGEHQDFLICSGCGAIESLDMSCPVEALEEEVARKSGFTGIYHELEFFGRCPACAG